MIDGVGRQETGEEQAEREERREKLAGGTNSTTLVPCLAVGDARHETADMEQVLLYSICYSEYFV